ncbi:MAG: MFS transporter [Solobacterium sp.]|nr:MFS transporter [Solobacterium sp.]
MAENKYDVGNGIHRVPLWRIAGFTLNNTATNLYLFMMNFIAYYINGWVGLGVVLAGSFSMIMRIWDGVTDPFVGYMLDKTNGKFGKNRPYMIIGNIILFVTSFLMFYVTPSIPEGAARVFWFIFINAIYYLGYTAQCVVTKSAQSCLTNDPVQRPRFAIFDTIFNLILFMGGQMWVSSYLAPKYGGFTADIALYHELWRTLALISAVFTAIAVFSIWPKDNIKYFGTGEPVRVRFRDYWEVIKNNKAIQMLVLSASTDKLANAAKTSVITVIMYGIVVGNYALSGGFSLWTSIGNVVFVIILLGWFAGKYGQRQTMLLSSWVALIGNVLMALLWLFGNPRSFGLPGYDGFNGWTFFTIALLVLTIVTGGFQGVAGNIVIPMTADCADYETYRSGRYVPGLMGTLFSFVDKLVSSLAPFIASLLLAAIGFREKMPDVDTPYSPGLLYVGVFLTYGMMVIGLLFNVVCMQKYPLTKEKMDEIREKIAEIKAAHNG